MGWRRQDWSGKEAKVIERRLGGSKQSAQSLSTALSRDFLIQKRAAIHPRK